MKYLYLQCGKNNFTDKHKPCNAYSDINSMTRSLYTFDIYADDFFK